MKASGGSTAHVHDAVTSDDAERGGGGERGARAWHPGWTVNGTPWTVRCSIYRRALGHVDRRISFLRPGSLNTMSKRSSPHCFCGPTCQIRRPTCHHLPPRGARVQALGAPLRRPHAFWAGAPRQPHAPTPAASPGSSPRAASAQPAAASCSTGCRGATTCLPPRPGLRLGPRRLGPHQRRAAHGVGPIPWR
jgi:hypothetical protein